MTGLTTTSYAALGLIARRPMSGYELTEIMLNSAVGDFWPRARSKLYEEPKKLVEHGLAKGAEEPVGKRPRTVYSITPEGRRALEVWLSQDSKPRSLEFEGALKVLFADLGSIEQLRANLDAIENDLVANVYANLPFVRSLVQDGFRFEDQAHLSALAGSLVARLARAQMDWIEWARQSTDVWTDTEGSPEKVEWARSAYQEILDRAGEARDQER